MADLTGGHLVARTLKQAGVGHIFTLCGGHILPIYDGCLNEDIAVVDMRHEQAAAHAADAYARLTRNIGVAVVTAGPGVTDAVTGVANAYSARSPVLLIGGAAPLGLRGLGALQETEQVGLLRPITKGVVVGGGDAPDPGGAHHRHPHRAHGPARAGLRRDPGGSPHDHGGGPARAHPHGATSTASVRRRDPDAVQRLADLLGRAKRPVVMAGSGVYWDDAAKDLQAFAERAGVPVFMNGAGRGCLPGEHPLAFAQARGIALGQADVVLVLGTPLDFRLGYGRPPSFAEDAQVAMVDCDPSSSAGTGRWRWASPATSAWCSRQARRRAAAGPAARAARVAGARCRKKEQDGQARLLAERQSDDVPISHYRMAHEIAAVMDAGTTVVGDGGDVVGCAAKIVPLTRPGQWLDPGPFGCLGVGPSFAIAAKLLRPADRVLLIAGDGAFGLNGMELETAVRFGLPMTVIVGNDGGWGQIRNPQLSFFGAERAVGTSLPYTRYDQMVEALGGRGMHVTRPRRDPARARARARLGRGLLHQRGPGPGRVPAHRPGLDGHLTVQSPSSRRTSASPAACAPSSPTRIGWPAAATRCR